MIQQITENEGDMSGQLVITAPPGQLAQLRELAADLSEWTNITTHGTIVVAEPMPEPKDA
jgi:hypothetical protein